VTVVLTTPRGAASALLRPGTARTVTDGAL